MKTRLFVTAVVFLATFTIASAQQDNKPCKGKCKGTSYVDANNNGICDKKEANDANKNANCDGTGQGKGKGKGKNFVDANNNGVCDKKEAQDKK